MHSTPADLEARYERLNLLYQVSNVIHSTLDARQALELILREAVRLMRASSGSVVLLNPTSGFLDIEAAHGLPEQAVGSSSDRARGLPAGLPARANQPGLATWPLTRATLWFAPTFVRS